MEYKLERGLIKMLNGQSNINVMVNVETGKVWGDEFSDGNSWYQYDDDKVHFAFKNDPLYGKKWTKEDVFEALNHMNH